MKSKGRFQSKRIQWCAASLLGAGLAASVLSAADTNAPPVTAPPALTPQQMFEGGTNSYNNWIELSAGGFVTGGNRAQFQQWRQHSGGPFGGIQDFHYQDDVAKATTLSADGHALFDEHDYKLSLGVVREKLGFLRVAYKEFRTWYNGDGGFYPPSDTSYPLSGNALGLDRGEISFEAGLTLEKAPKVTFKYTHTFRDGDKSSASWGIAHPDIGVTRGLSPSFYDIHENSDAFQLDATHHIKATDFGLGLRYESGKLDNALKIDQAPGEPVEQRITDREVASYDLFNVHAFTETWIRKNLLLSSGFSFSDLNNDFSGSRIYGSDFDVGYVPNALNGAGYLGSNGVSRMQEYVMDVNLLWKPTPHLTIVPSLRAQKEDTDASFSGIETLGSFTATPFIGNTDAGDLDVRERLDLSYNGITNWVCYARGEWTEGDGNLTANGGLGPVNGIGVPPIQQETDYSRFFQKYTAGARWYPSRRVTLDAGGYYKHNDYNYNNPLDSTANDSGNRYPAYLVMQNFETYDGNVRLTLRPWVNVSLVSRYEFQWSTLYMTPDPVSGLGGAESSKMTSHIIAQNISWIPWSRLCLQAGANYVQSETRTPVSDYTQAILAARNNYWTLNFSSGLVLDDRTDFNLGYFYYRADDYHDNSIAGVPYGAGAEEHSVTATIVRRISKNLRLTLKYGYSRYADAPSGGNNNYDAHLIYSSLQYRF